MGIVTETSMDLSEEDRALQEKVTMTLNNRKEDMKQTVQKWKSEKEANEEYIAQMRANKEARRKEMEEMERLKAQLLEDDEAESGEVPPEFADQVTKVEIVDKNQSFKSREQVEMNLAMNERIRPLAAVETFDTTQLQDRAKEYWKTITSLVMEKGQLATRLQEQDIELKEAREQLAEVVLAKQAKKGVDMERLALGPGGKASKHPPKKQMISKFDNRKGNRTYEERKDMYDEGVAQVRPKMLENVWHAKFSAWMEDDEACSFLEGKKGEEEILF